MRRSLRAYRRGKAWADRRRALLATGPATERRLRMAEGTVLASLRARKAGSDHIPDQAVAEAMRDFLILYRELGGDDV